MAWVFLICSGICEMIGVTLMKKSEGFTKRLPTIGAIAVGFLSFYTLSRALGSIPIGTAYAVWTGIGSAGSVLLGMIWFGESRSWLRLFFICCIIGGVAGLKFFGAEAA
ncbi:DMT family transporter [Paenibacillus thermoaerophilus]|uniref:DMT family transporter n=1 Tax=Paenibacillus thermoaerophilus TaxID=1215385 RepID=A0ABW2UZI3_9BACL|nr:multidrug efflux SMR transporter [Paenibacillus thermoaerophilus]TMV14363.1 multidrug efflux SMR transporter [Paenibacillus thermoaerophilus]